VGAVVFGTGVAALSGRALAMNKAELIEAMASESGLSKADAKRTVNGITGATTKALKKGDRIAVVGFGSFRASKRAARTGRNPQDEKESAAKKEVKFKAGAELSKAVN
jgi:DNA-binding protein HU-beta